MSKSLLSTIKPKNDKLIKFDFLSFEIKIYTNRFFIYFFFILIFFVNLKVINSALDFLSRVLNYQMTKRGLFNYFKKKKVFIVTTTLATDPLWDLFA